MSQRLALGSEGSSYETRCSNAHQCVWGRLNAILGIIRSRSRARGILQRCWSAGRALLVHRAPTLESAKMVIEAAPWSEQAELERIPQDSPLK